jgi:uncharacterized protein with FMN-binding domain
MGSAPPPVATPTAPVVNSAVVPASAAASAPENPNARSTSAESTVATPAAVPVHYKDGTYTGWGTCRHGDIEAKVVIEGGRIASAEISQCLTRYSCSWIAALPPQVVTDQSPETDIVSGATQSSDAFYYAVVEALGKAK